LGYAASVSDASGAGAEDCSTVPQLRQASAVSYSSEAETMSG
jgi:hypothetical protein